MKFVTFHPPPPLCLVEPPESALYWFFFSSWSLKIRVLDRTKQIMVKFLIFRCQVSLQIYLNVDGKIELDLDLDLMLKRELFVG